MVNSTGNTACASYTRKKDENTINSHNSKPLVLM